MCSEVQPTANCVFSSSETHSTRDQIMQKSEFDRLDRYALYAVFVVWAIHMHFFPYFKNFMIPAELYAHFPAVIHPYMEFYAKPRENIDELTRGIQHSAPTYSLPTSGQLFCFVETSEEYYNTRVPSVASTWLPRCDNGRFFSKTPLPDHRLPFSTVYSNLEDSYYDLFRKTLLSFYYSYTHISDKFDWYMKADDDNYIVMDHLKEYLNQLDPSKPLYLGYRMKPFLEHGYHSGGAGYILSNAAVKKFVENLYYDEEACPYDWAEDRGLGRCLASMDILPEDTRDEEGLNRFNAFPAKEILQVHPDYHYYPLKNGSSSTSKKFVSLHRISPENMLLLDDFLYPKSGKRNFSMEILNNF